MDPCPTCGKDRTLVGYRHLCSPVTKIVTSDSRDVTKNVTPPCSRCIDLEAEVKHLKKLLAERQPKSTAERVRKHRARRGAP